MLDCPPPFREQMLAFIEVDSNESSHGLHVVEDFLISGVACSLRSCRQHNNKFTLESRSNNKFTKEKAVLIVMNALKTLDRIVEKLEEWLLAFGTIALTLLLLMNVFLRTFFSRSIVMAEEVSRIIVIGITFIGLSYVARHGSHIRMDVIYDMINKKYRKILATIIPLVTSVTLYYLANVAFRYTRAIKLSNRVTASLQIPVHYITALVVIGLILSGTQYARIFYLNLKNIRNDEEDFIGTYRKASKELSD